MVFREEVINVELAKILREFGLKANPEVIESYKLPDVLIILGGIRLIMEGRTTANVLKLHEKAKERLEDGIAHISMSLLYPENIREVDDLDKVKTELKKSIYSGKIFYWSIDGIKDITFKDVSIKELVNSINRLFTLYVENNILIKKIQEIDLTLKNLADKFAHSTIFFSKPKVEKDLKKALGISDD